MTLAHSHTVASPGKPVILKRVLSLVRAIGCPNGGLGGVSSNSSATVDPSGHVETSTGLTATIRGAEASGVFAAADICAGKTFKWTAHGAP
jgi:hypothetical protein